MFPDIPGEMRFFPFDFEDGIVPIFEYKMELNKLPSDPDNPEAHS